MQALSAEFAKIPDRRLTNASYKLTDFLRGAFAMFSLKSPSLLALEEQTKIKRRNLHSIYHIGAIPSDTQMREALGPVDPAPLQKLFATPFATLETAGAISEYHFWRDFVSVTVDGVEHFSSTEIHRANCTMRTSRNGTRSYHHAGLGAVLVNPASEEVFPLDFEPLLKENGAKKNDCERNAAKRLRASLHEQYPDLNITLVEDELSENGPRRSALAAALFDYARIDFAHIITVFTRRRAA